MFVFALIVATGAVFVTTWTVWLCAGLVALVFDKVVGDRFVVGGP